MQNFPHEIHFSLFICSKIHKTRKIFESRIVQPDKEIKDFLEYIKYERKLISTSKERFQTLHIMEENTIAPLIALHLKQLYSEALSEFPQNTRFWDEYIKFLQQFKFYGDISDAFERMLKVCQHNYYNLSTNDFMRFSLLDS